MTKFEQIGVNMQYDAPTKETAQQKFSRSCQCCCTKGLHISCDKCAIETAHRLVIASFETINNNANHNNTTKENKQKRGE